MFCALPFSTYKACDSERQLGGGDLQRLLEELGGLDDACALDGEDEMVFLPRKTNGWLVVSRGRKSVGSASPFASSGSLMHSRHSVQSLTCDAMRCGMRGQETRDVTNKTRSTRAGVLVQDKSTSKR